MSGPNLVTISSVVGKTLASDITTTLAEVVANPTGSGQVYKINVLYVSNTSNSLNSTVTVEFFRNITGTRIADAIPVPVGNSLVVIAKDTSLYLEEGDSLKILSSTNNTLQAVVSYEIIS